MMDCCLVQRTVYKCPLADNIGISLHTCTFINYPIKSHFNKKINELISNKKIIIVLDTLRILDSLH